VTVEGIETAHGRVEAKAALAVLADDDAGNLVVIPSMVYPSDMGLLAPAMPASSCSDWSVWIAERRQVTAASTTAAGSIQGADAAKHRAERGRRALCHGATPCETESTKTPRGTLAFDDAAQAALRNHRGRVHTNFDTATLAAFPATPNQANLQCLFARKADPTQTAGVDARLHTGMTLLRKGSVGRGTTPADGRHRTCRRCGPARRAARLFRGAR
jgi:hypothetical protein